MSDDEENKDEKAAPKKKPVVLFAIIGVVLLGGVGAAVVFAGPALGIGGDESAAEAKATKKKKKPKKGEAKAADGESADGEADLPEEDPATAGIKSKISRLNSLVVDVQDTDGSRHHVKINIAVEHPEGKEEEFVTLEPRARESLILYLRTLNFAQATDPNGFGKIRDEVIQRMRKAFGEEFPARRILITDFVAQ
ncbi:MAG: flagellar basal body-associated FliL family protein [Polyangiaceae bacterium]|nr:flagellar basal body-associated FliL family protein [Polyangiaceae bacterium]